MNREIKFRAWDIDSSCIHYSEDETGVSDFFFQFNKKGILELMMPVEDDFAEKREAVISQFTGINDKTGKDVYEGDIIKDSEEIYQVVFEEYNAESYLVLGWALKNNHTCFGFGQNDSPVIEIIGNIYENPELL